MNTHTKLTAQDLNLSFDHKGCIGCKHQKHWYSFVCVFSACKPVFLREPGQAPQIWQWMSYKALTRMTSNAHPIIYYIHDLNYTLHMFVAKMSG